MQKTNNIAEILRSLEQMLSRTGQWDRANSPSSAGSAFQQYATYANSYRTLGYVRSMYGKMNSGGFVGGGPSGSAGTTGNAGSTNGNYNSRYNSFTTRNPFRFNHSNAIGFKSTGGNWNYGNGVKPTVSVSPRNEKFSFSKMGYMSRFLLRSFVAIPAIVGTMRFLSDSVKQSRQMTRWSANLATVGAFSPLGMQGVAGRIGSKYNVRQEDVMKSSYQLLSSGLNNRQMLKALPISAQMQRAGLMSGQTASSFLGSVANASGLEKAVQNKSFFRDIGDAVAFSIKSKKVLGTDLAGAFSYLAPLVAQGKDASKLIKSWAFITTMGTKGRATAVGMRNLMQGKNLEKVYNKLGMKFNPNLQYSDYMAELAARPDRLKVYSAMKSTLQKRELNPAVLGVSRGAELKAFANDKTSKGVLARMSKRSSKLDVWSQMTVDTDRMKLALGNMLKPLAKLGGSVANSFNKSFDEDTLSNGIRKSYLTSSYKSDRAFGNSMFTNIWSPEFRNSTPKADRLLKDLPEEARKAYYTDISNAQSDAEISQIRADYYYNFRKKKFDKYKRDPLSLKKGAIARGLGSLYSSIGTNKEEGRGISSIGNFLGNFGLMANEMGLKGGAKIFQDSIRGQLATGNRGALMNAYSTISSIKSKYDFSSQYTKAEALRSTGSPFERRLAQLQIDVLDKERAKGDSLLGNLEEETKTAFKRQMDNTSTQADLFKQLNEVTGDRILVEKTLINRTQDYVKLLDVILKKLKSEGYSTALPKKESQKQTT